MIKLVKKDYIDSKSIYKEVKLNFDGKTYNFSEFQKCKYFIVFGTDNTNAAKTVIFGNNVSSFQSLNLNVGQASVTYVPSVGITLSNTTNAYIYAIVFYY